MSHAVEQAARAFKTLISKRTYACSRVLRAAHTYPVGNKHPRATGNYLPEFLVASITVAFASTNLVGQTASAVSVLRFTAFCAAAHLGGARVLLHPVTFPQTDAVRCPRFQARPSQK